MGVLEKLSRFVGGDGGAACEATAALTRCYVACTRRAQQLRQHAEMAPQQYSAEGLSELAAAEERQAARLRDALQTAAGGSIPSASPQPPAPGAVNHWRRLVQDLEAHRLSVEELRELTIHFAETLPKTAELFEHLCREEVTHCEHLRALIARADPQALD